MLPPRANTDAFEACPQQSWQSAANYVDNAAGGAYVIRDHNDTFTFRVDVRQRFSKPLTGDKSKLDACYTFSLFDCDNDGFLDFWCTTNFGFASLQLAHNRKNGRFDFVTHNGVKGARIPALADFDGSGSYDLIMR